MICKIDHIGIAIKSIDKALEFYNKQLGLNCEDIEYIEIQDVRAAFLAIGDSEIELLEPAGENSTIKKFMEKRGEGIHHIAFRVSNIKEEIEGLKGLGIQLIDETPVYGVGGASIAFIHPKSTGGVLVGLCER